MGSQIKINDTLQITREQGFPEELDIEKHLETPYKTEDFEGRVFEFKDKEGIRLYQIPPVRNFLVENKDGKWIYWGLVHIIEIHHDCVKQTTGGKFKIIYLNTPEEMKQVFSLTDQRPEKDYFNF